MLQNEKKYGPGDRASFTTVVVIILLLIIISCLFTKMRGDNIMIEIHQSIVENVP